MLGGVGDNPSIRNAQSNDAVFPALSVAEIVKLVQPVSRFVDGRYEIVISEPSSYESHVAEVQFTVRFPIVNVIVSLFMLPCKSVTVASISGFSSLV